MVDHVYHIMYVPGIGRNIEGASTTMSAFVFPHIRGRTDVKGETNGEVTDVPFL